ncbi:dicer-2 protein [Halteromyces radiatus]|uniref:dicer-2 protein n=1 Tax=Halteromyces radiatus TaxID=101107 RepID=UPI00221F0233|nr:dicer-2 protein [Halteromyces radiatus]KAI8093080.1 dicer-2 protein [Halteromyces radiatus]
MPGKALNLTTDDLDTDEAVNVAPDVVENTMNEGLDQAYLANYIDVEFLNMTPDILALTADQLELERKEKLDRDELELELQGNEEENTNVILSPREYQYELYNRAINENVIAVLHTGSGKTLIAVMLIKYMALQEKHDRLTRRKTKLTFFLVDRVPLVFQQAAVISANCDVEVDKMCGQMDVDNWSEKKWKTIFEEKDVCVMTAQIFLDTLRHGYVHMDKVNLLIFDECHHGTKKHPYNVIMREFYDTCPENERPRIFGMTASPMNSESGVQYSATQLEKNLCSRIYTATNLDTLATFLNPPKEVQVEYAGSPSYPETPLTLAIRDKLGYIERYDHCFRRVTHTLHDLGPWCSDRLWKYLLTDLERRLKVQSQDMDAESLLAEDKALQECADMVDNNSVPERPPFTIQWFSPKMIRLFEILLIYRQWAFNQEFCGIIFVTTRHTAKAIQLAIESHPDLEPFKCGVLIGHGGREEGDIHMGFRDQNRIITQFRKGKLNLLIATNVAEEGLDIQPCNVVIRFDFMSSPIGYIQSRGRARKKGSRFIIMMETKDGTLIRKLDDYRRMEDGMREFCQTLPANRNVALKFANNDVYDRPYDPEEDDDEEYMEDAYMVKETQAMVTKQSAVPLLYRYCGSLPSDRFTALTPSFEIISSTAEGHVCTVRLPSNAAVRQVTSKACRTKIQAKKVAAVNCCKELHLKKALTDHLLPINYKHEMLGNMEVVLDENGMVVGSRRRRAIYEKRIPRFWNRPSDQVVEEETNVDQETEIDLIAARVTASTALVENTMIASNTIDSVRIPNMDIIDKVNDNNGTASPATSEVTGSPPISTATTITPTTEVDQIPEKIPLDDMDGPFQLWLSVIKFDIPQGELDGVSLRRLCLMTWQQFPAIPELKLFARGDPFTVQVQSFTSPISVTKDDIMVLKEFNLIMASAITNRDFSCTLDDFPYFFVPLIINDTAKISSESIYDLFDWEEMRYAIGKTFTPLDLENQQTLENAILVDYADKNRRYFVNRVCNEMTPLSPLTSLPEAVREIGFDHLGQYYEEKFKVTVTKWDQPLIHVRKISKVMNYLSPMIMVEPQLRKSTASYLIPEFCQKYYVNASVFQSWMIIPSITTRLDAILSAQEARQRYQLWIDDDYMLEAYTTPSANMEMDYERLETLGDSFLKFVATIRLYTNFPFSDEGELHCLRIRVVCNRALYRAAKRLKIFRYVSSHTFNRKHWRPHRFIAATDTEDTLKDAKSHMLSDKTLADIVEASLGAAYISGGLESGLRCAIAMQIPFDDIQTWSDFWPTYLASREKLPPRAEIAALRTVDLLKVQEVCQYEFKNPLLVVEALTHASLPNSTAPCYQRLEFLGDAVLDFLVIRYLYNKYPEADPGLITDLKDACVNNHVLGIVCFENLLHRHIIHYSGILLRAIEESLKEITEIKESGNDVGEYWLSLNIPKVLSDVVESMLGAVFVDSQFDLDPVQKLFEVWLVPLLDIHVTPALIQVHPVNRMITKLQRLGCDAFLLRNVTTSSADNAIQKCVIFLHDKPFATGASENIKVARRQAAERALQRLEDEPDILDRVCNCGIIRQRKEQNMALEEEDHYF